jgi:hypothetical protein
MVVNNNGEVIGGKSVALQEHGIVGVLIWEAHEAANSIREGRVPFVGHAQANGWRFAGGYATRALFRGKPEAMAIVFGRVALFLLRLPCGFEALWGAKTWVGLPYAYKLIGCRTVAFQAGRLHIGAKGAFLYEHAVGRKPGAFICHDAKGRKVAHDALHAIFNQSLLIGIFYAQNEGSATLMCKKAAPQGLAQPSNM